MCDFGMMVVCKSCGKDVLGDDFNAGLHDCPMSLKPKEGETFEEYKGRCREHKHATLAEKGGG